MTRLILARHGNTFGPQDKPVWVGSRADIPLVEKGIAQAHAIADAMQTARFSPDVIFTGPLQRTHETARIVAADLNLATDRIRIDPRLIEIDYGAWEGSTNAEIEAMGDGAALIAWDKQSVYPEKSGWSPSQAQLVANATAMLAEMREGTAMIVTSNGILRYFAGLAANAAEFPALKVSTGNICVMQRDITGWSILQWNQPPEKPKN